MQLVQEHTGVKTAYLALAALLLTACATSPPPQPIRWSKPGATTDQFNADRYQCAREALVAGGGNPSFGQMIANSLAGGASIALGQPNPLAQSQGGVSLDPGLFIMCMQARGYSASP